MTKGEDTLRLAGLRPADVAIIDETVVKTLDEDVAADEVFILNYDAASTKTNALLRFFLDVAKPGISVETAVRQDVRVCLAVRRDEDMVLEALPGVIAAQLRKPAPEGAVYLVVVRNERASLLTWKVPTPPRGRVN